MCNQKITSICKTVPTMDDNNNVDICTIWYNHDQGQMIRLKGLPIKYRTGRWNSVVADIVKHPKDDRVHSYTVADYSGFGRISSLGRNAAALKREMIDSAIVPSVEYLWEDPKTRSIGMVKPREITRIYVGEPIKDAVRPDGTKSRDVVPSMRIKYKCGNQDCKGHDMRVRDWEARVTAQRTGINQTIKTYNDILENKDAYLVLGNMESYKTRPHAYMIIGIVYVNKE